MDKMVIVNNYFRILVAGFFFALLFAGCTSDGSSSEAKTTDAVETEYTKTVPPSEFLAAYRANPGAAMIDVRTSKEFRAGRIVQEAINIDYHSDQFLEEIVVQDRSIPIFIYCFSGGRSSKAAFKMRQLGYDRIYECKGGYQAWQKDRSDFSKE